MKVQPKHIIIGGSIITLAGLIFETLQKFKSEEEAENEALAGKNLNFRIEQPQTIDADFEIIEPLKLTSKTK